MIDFTLVRIADTSARPALSWAQGREFYLPAALVSEQKLVKGNVDALSITDIRRCDAGEVLAMRTARAFTETKPLSSRLPISYQVIPASVRSVIGRFTGKRGLKRMLARKTYPLWPLDLSADLLEDLLLPDSPAPATCPVVLTHDIDSAEGLANYHEDFLPIEAGFHAVSTLFVVPAAWTIDHGMLSRIVAEGHSVGVHGCDHNNRTAYCDPAEIRNRLDKSATLRERYGANGYRAPSLVRTRALLRGLEDAGFLYDSSIPSSGGPLPVPHTGCASARPFRIGNVWEVPLSMPRDGSLRFLGHTPTQILDIWKRCALAIAASGGVVVLLTHCERRFSGNPEMLACYADFLDFLSSEGRFSFQRIEDVISKQEEILQGNSKNGVLS